MDDLISRRDAIDDAHKQIWYRMNHHGMKDRIDEWLNSLPSAQPEIIRCKDCKHRDVENGFCEGRGWPMQLVPDDGFCDKGERKEDTNEDNH